MKHELIFMVGEEAEQMAEELEARHEARIKLLQENGAKTVEGIFVDGGTFRSVLNAED